MKTYLRLPFFKTILLFTFKLYLENNFKSVVPMKEVITVDDSDDGFGFLRLEGFSGVSDVVVWDECVECRVFIVS